MQYNKDTKHQKETSSPQSIGALSTNKAHTTESGTSTNQHHGKAKDTATQANNHNKHHRRRHGYQGY